MNWSFHYVTDKPKNLIASFKRRDLRTMERIREMEKLKEIFKDSFHLDTACLISHQLTEADLEDTVVIQRGSIVSVYPIVETERQIENETWVKFDTRASSLAQEKGSLVCEKKAGKLRMEFWVHGERRALESQHEILTTHFSSLLRDYFAKKEVRLHHIKEALEITDDAQKIRQLETLLPFPLFLYSDWRSHWQAKAISPHLYLVSEEEAK